MSFGQAFAASGASGTSVAAKDISGHWSENVLKEWQQQGLLSGYQDGTLQPDHKITRAEFAALINKSFGYTNTAEIAYKDVKASNWFYADIAKATAAGYIKGYTDQTFRPNQPLTREEMAAIVSSILKLSATDSPAAFSDTAVGHQWSKLQINAIAQAGLMSGNDQKFRPLDTATRAEAVSVLDRALKFAAAKSSEKVVYDKAGNYGPETGLTTVKGSVYIEAPGVVLNNTLITGDLVIGEGVGKGDVTLKNVTVKGTTTIAGGGKNSIHVVDSVLVTVIVNKKDGSIRIVTEGASSVEQITLQSGALLEEGSGTGSGFGNVDLSAAIPANAQVSLAGSFETVDVMATSIQVNLSSGSIGQLQVAPGAGNTGIDITGGARINALILNAIARVTGTGSIGTASINANGSTLAQTPEHVNYGNNATAVIGTPVVSGGGSSGGSSGDSSGGSNGGSNGSNPGTVTETVYGFEGVITDVDDQPVADMTIHFRRGLGATTGEIAATVVTDAAGKYFANLAPGVYTGELSKSGFITTHVVGASLSTHKNINQNATAIKIPANDEIRIVLTWDLLPLDEDSHLIGAAPNNRSFHTWYGDRVYSYNNQTYADLDHDDVDSYGPETTTIRKRVDGKYTFFVHNFSGNGTAQANTLTASGAKVEIYNGHNATPVKTYHIPVTDTKMLYWYVFDMNISGSELTFVDKNMLTDTAPKSDLDQDNGQDTESPTVNTNFLSVENHAGANDVVNVRSLAPGDVVSVYADEIDHSQLLQTATVAEGSTSVKLTGLDFGADSTTVYISLKKPNHSESHAVPISVYSEAQYAELEATVAASFKDQVLPGTMTVGDVVYLPDPQQPLPRDLRVTVLNYDGPSTVTDDVYILRDYMVWYMNYNGTADPVDYSIKLELKRDFSAVTKEIIITVPSVFTALPDSVELAEKMLLDDSTHPGLAEAVTDAKAVINNTDATAADWLEAIKALHEIFNQIARENE
ncbi:S-layer homology domain-containing protein [Paenibacillus sp. FSL H3-0319]